MKRVTLLAVGAYAAAVPLPSNSLLSEELRVQLYNIRPYVLIAILLFALAERIYSLGGGMLLPSALERRAFVLSLIFPAYYFVVSLIKGTFSFPVAALYGAWSLCAFLLAPMLIRNVRDVRVVSGVLVVANLSTWVFAFVYERQDHVSHSLIYGGPYGYINGDYFAQVVLVTVASALIYVTARRASGLRWKPWQLSFVLVGFVAAGAFVTVLAARSAVAFLAVGALTFLVLRRGRNVWIVHAFLLAAMMLMVYALAFPENKALDVTTSERLTVWRTAIETIGNEPTPVLPILTGTTIGNLQTADFSSRYDPLGAEKAFSKFHVDNSFLELFLEGGLFGLVFFLWPYVIIVRSGLTHLGESHRKTTLMATSLALLVGLAALSLTTTTIPTFNSPIGIFAALLGTLPAAVQRLGLPEESEVASAYIWEPQPTSA